MERLSEKEWKPVSLGEVYNNYHGKRLTKEKRISGTTPLLTAGESNNGVAEFISNANMPQYSKFVSVDMFGNSFFHPYRATGDDNIYFFENLHLTAETKEFTCVSIEKQSCKFSYGKQFRQRNADSLKTMLPVTDSGEPDYAYMAEYVQQKRAAMLDKYHKYVEARIAELGELVEIPMLDEKEWDEFFIGDLFEVSRPKSRNKDDYDFGNTPFVASGALNNGVMKCCDAKQDEQLDAGNCITVSPVDGSTFYQPMDFLGRGGAGSSILMLRSDSLNLYLGQFIARTVRQTCSKYTYGHMGNKDSIKRERIMLPIDDSGKPDYEYMEQYAKNMMLRKYKQYLEFVNRQNVTEVD